MTEPLKSIQKYPELADCKTSKEYVDLTFALHPEPPNGATSQVIEQRNEALIAALLENPFSSDEQKQDIRNQTWEINQIRLTSTIYRLIAENDRMPSTANLAKETGLSRVTVRKHLTKFHQSPFYQDQLQQLRMLSTQVVIKLFDLAMQGDVKAAKIYLGAVGGLPRVEPGVLPKPATNYIQINNNVKIDQLTFGLLPETVQQQITRLVLQGLQTTTGLPTPSENQ